MRFVPVATAAAALMLGAGAAQAALYCDQYRPNVCIDQPDPPANPPSLTYNHPPGTTYTYRVEPSPPSPPPQASYQYRVEPSPSSPPPQVTYQYRVEPSPPPPPPQATYRYQAPPAVTVHPQPAYPPQPSFSIRVE